METILERISSGIQMKPPLLASRSLLIFYWLLEKRRQKNILKILITDIPIRLYLNTKNNIGKYLNYLKVENKQ